MRWMLVLLCCTVLNAQAEIFSAKVIVVMDGDTVMVLRGGQKLKIRLANIDAPEVAHAGMGEQSPGSQQGQSFGMQSRASLEQMVGRKQVRVESLAQDQYGRTVGLLSVDGLNVNAEQLRRGMAWEYSHYHADKQYVALQSEAQQARRGLWSESDAQAPWQWRKNHPSVKTGADKPLTGQSGQSYDAVCGQKRHCAQMSSCAEATFYLTRCAELSLDRNKNGKACEELCNAVK